MKPKPAYSKMIEKLNSFPKDHAAVIARNLPLTSQESV
jgi:hypothetical protein